MSVVLVMTSMLLLEMTCPWTIHVVHVLIEFVLFVYVNML